MVRFSTFLQNCVNVFYEAKLGFVILYIYTSNMSPYYYETMCVVFAGGWVHIQLLKDLYPPQVGIGFFSFSSLFHREQERRCHRGQRLSQAADKEHTTVGGALVCAPRPATNPSDRVGKWLNALRCAGGTRLTPIAGQ